MFKNTITIHQFNNSSIIIEKVYQFKNSFIIEAIQVQFSLLKVFTIQAVQARFSLLKVSLLRLFSFDSVC